MPPDSSQLMIDKCFIFIYNKNSYLHKMCFYADKCKQRRFGYAVFYD